jgi:RHS repeat-associated protein
VGFVLFVAAVSTAGAGWRGSHCSRTQAAVTYINGTAVEHIRYKPYGEVRGHYDSTGTEEADNTCADDHYCHEFTGYDTEPVSGLQYAGARFYDPELGMFLTHDPARQFANPYAYGPWDPVNGTDPNGTFFFELFLIAAITFFDVGAHTGDVKTALVAGVVAGVTAGVTSVAVAKIAPIVAPLLTPTVKFAVQLAAVGAGGYATYESERHGQGAAAAFAALGTVAAAYGILADAVGAQPVGPGGGLHRAGGENENFLQKLGDYVDDWTAQKNVVQPGSKEAGILSQSINEVPYTPTGEGLQETLNSGRVYTYEQRFGGAELYSREGNIFVPTRSLGLPTNYLGGQLAHEYFHVLSYQFTGLSGSEVFANRFGEASTYIGPSRVQILANYPTAPDLYRAVLRGPLNY